MAIRKVIRKKVTKKPSNARKRFIIKKQMLSPKYSGSTTRQKIQLISQKTIGNMHFMIFTADGRSSISSSITPTANRISNTSIRLPYNAKSATRQTSSLSGETLYRYLPNNPVNIYIPESIKKLSLSDKATLKTWLRSIINTTKINNYGYFPVSVFTWK